MFFSKVIESMSKLERIVAIVEEVNRGNYPTIKDLCAKFKIDEQTLNEDIRFIRDRMEIELLLDSFKGGYYNSTPDRELPNFDLNEQERAILALGIEMLLNHSGAGFGVPSKEALAKIEGRLGKKEMDAVEEFRGLIRTNCD